jgi:hypothetical protein
MIKPLYLYLIIAALAAVVFLQRKRISALKTEVKATSSPQPVKK